MVGLLVRVTVNALEALLVVRHCFESPKVLTLLHLCDSLSAVVRTGCHSGAAVACTDAYLYQDRFKDVTCP